MPSLLAFLFLALAAAASDASKDALPTLEHRRFSEYVAYDYESTGCHAEDISLIQLHAQKRGYDQATGFTSLKDGVVANSEHVAAVLVGGEPSDQKARVLRQRLLVAAGLGFAAIALASYFCYLFNPTEDDGAESENEFLEVLRNEQLPADTLGFLVCSIVRDSEHIALQKPHRGSRVGRIMIAFCTLSLNYLIQVYMFGQILTYIVPEDVSHIRQNYVQYERIMYEGHTQLSVNGEARGKEGWFNPKQFAKLDDDLKGEMCSTPWSQPWFFLPLIFIWTCSCVREMKAATDLIHILVVRMPTVHSMDQALHCTIMKDSADGICHDKKEPPAKNENVQTIVGLTRIVKGIILCGVLLPRICISGFLCWLGCRWLAAANDFGDMVLDTVALEFLLLLKFLLYEVLVADRNKRDLQQTEVRPPTHTERANFWVYISTTAWSMLVLGWVYFFCTYFQMVLLDFRWDLSDVCSSWMAAEYPIGIV